MFPLFQICHNLRFQDYPTHFLDRDVKMNQQTTGEERKYQKTEDIAQKEKIDQMIGTEYADSSVDSTATTTGADKVVSYITKILELSHT